jgi:hypothetical protein
MDIRRTVVGRIIWNNFHLVKRSAPADFDGRVAKG